MYVGQSLISGAGEGLFAKTEAEVNTVMAFYNGVRITHTEVCLFAFYIQSCNAILKKVYFIFLY